MRLWVVRSFSGILEDLEVLVGFSEVVVGFRGLSGSLWDVRSFSVILEVSVGFSRIWVVLVGF